MLVCLLLLWPAILSADKASDVLYVSATLDVNWTQKLAEGTAEGEMSYTISGVLKLNEQFSSNAPELGLQPIDIWYQNAGLTASFTFDEKVTSNDADCPNPIRELHGGGPIKVPNITPGVLNIKYLGSLRRNTELRNMPLTGMAADVLKDHYLLVLAAGPAEAHGTVTYKDGDQCKKRKINIDFSPKIQAAYLMDSAESISGEQSWSSSQRDFQIKVSNLPPSFNLKPKEPSSPASNDSKVNYKVRWKIKVPPFVTINRMDPSDDANPGENITDQKRDIWIGEKVTLEARLYPLPKGDDKMRIGNWSIPGSILKRWDAGLSSARPIELEKDDFERVRIEFYWKTASQNGDSHKLNFTPRKNCEPAETTFEVKRPAIELTVSAAQNNSYGYLNFGDQSASSSCCIQPNEQFAEDCKKRKAMNNSSDIAGLSAHYNMNDMEPLCLGIQYNGIHFEAELPDDTPGEVEYVQLISIQEEFDYVDQMGDRHKNSRSVTPGLDGCYPYPMNSPPLGTADTPGFGLSNAGFRTVNDTFEMYLMYRPPATYPNGHEWVPIKKVPWSWGATISCSQQQGSAQSTQITCQSQDGEFPPIQPQAQDIERYPVWNICNSGE